MRASVILLTFLSIELSNGLPTSINVPDWKQEHVRLSSLMVQRVTSRPVTGINNSYRLFRKKSENNGDKPNLNNGLSFANLRSRTKNLEAASKKTKRDKSSAPTEAPSKEALSYQAYSAYISNSEGQSKQKRDTSYYKTSENFNDNVSDMELDSERLKREAAINPSQVKSLATHLSGVRGGNLFRNINDGVKLRTGKAAQRNNGVNTNADSEGNMTGEVESDMGDGSVNVNKGGKKQKKKGNGGPNGNRRGGRRRGNKKNKGRNNNNNRNNNGAESGGARQSENGDNMNRENMNERQDNGMNGGPGNGNNMDNGQENGRGGNSGGRGGNGNDMSQGNNPRMNENNMDGSQGNGRGGNSGDDNVMSPGNNPRNGMNGGPPGSQMGSGSSEESMEQGSSGNGWKMEGGYQNPMGKGSTSVGNDGMQTGMDMRRPF